MKIATSSCKMFSIAYSSLYTTIFAHRCHYFPFVSRFSIVHGIEKPIQAIVFLYHLLFFHLIIANSHFTFFFGNKRDKKTSIYFLQIISTMVERLSWHERPIVCFRIDFHIFNGTFLSKMKDIRSWLLKNDSEESLQNEECAEGCFILQNWVVSVYEIGNIRRIKKRRYTKMQRLFNYLFWNIYKSGSIASLS